MIQAIHHASRERFAVDLSLLGHDGLRFTRQREPLYINELRRQQRHQRQSAYRVRLVPADRYVSTSGRRHRLLLRGGDARSVEEHQRACSYDPGSNRQVASFQMRSVRTRVGHGLDPSVD